MRKTCEKHGEFKDVLATDEEVRRLTEEACARLRR